MLAYGGLGFGWYVARAKTVLFHLESTLGLAAHSRRNHCVRVYTATRTHTQSPLDVESEAPSALAAATPFVVMIHIQLNIRAPNHSAAAAFRMCYGRARFSANIVTERGRCDRTTGRGPVPSLHSRECVCVCVCMVGSRASGRSTPRVTFTCYCRIASMYK